MKKITIILAIVTAIIFLQSCSQKYYDKHPKRGCPMANRIGDRA